MRIKAQLSCRLYTEALKKNLTKRERRLHSLDSGEFDFYNKLSNFFSVGLAVTNNQGLLLHQNSHLAFILKRYQVSINFHYLLSLNGVKKRNECTLTFGDKIFRLSHSGFREKGRSELYHIWLIFDDAGISEDVIVRESKNPNLAQNFLDNSFEILFRTDAQGDLLYFNERFLTFFGFDSHKQALDFNVKALFHTPRIFMQIMRRLERQGRIFSKQVEFINTQKKPRVGMLNCCRTNNRQGVNVFDWTVLDISEQHNYEVELKDKDEELRKVNLQMEKFLYSTSHDLRAPLTSILGLVNLTKLLSGDSEILDLMEKIEISARKLDQIIQDIVSYSRTRYQRTVTQRIDFESLIWAILDKHKTPTIFRRLEVNVTVHDHFPFYADPTLLEVILDNVLRNSIHFFDENKSKPLLSITITQQEMQVDIQVIDNGIGIARQHLENIFNMFYKATNQSHGAGLGLFIVKETIQKLKGTLAVESEIGFGTVFNITLPNDHKGQLISRKINLKKSGISLTKD